MQNAPVIYDTQAAEAALAIKIEEIHRTALILLKEQIEKAEIESRDAEIEAEESDETEEYDAQEEQDVQQSINPRDHPLYKLGDHFEGIHTTEILTERIVSGVLMAALGALGLIFGRAAGDQPDVDPKNEVPFELVDESQQKSDFRKTLPSGAIDVDASIEADQQALPEARKRLQTKGDGKARDSLNEASLEIMDDPQQESNSVEALPPVAIDVDASVAGLQALGASKGEAAVPSEFAKKEEKETIMDLEIPSAGYVAVPLPEAKIGTNSAGISAEVIPLPDIKEGAASRSIARGR